jgi:hypothetical protein
MVLSSLSSSICRQILLKFEYSDPCFFLWFTGICDDILNLEGSFDPDADLKYITECLQQIEVILLSTDSVLILYV